jgi:hypothetical protein
LVVKIMNNSTHNRTPELPRRGGEKAFRARYVYAELLAQAFADSLAILSQRMPDAYAEPPAPEQAHTSTERAVASQSQPAPRTAAAKRTVSFAEYTPPHTANAPHLADQSRPIDAAGVQQLVDQPPADAEALKDAALAEVINAYREEAGLPVHEQVIAEATAPVPTLATPISPLARAEAEFPNDRYLAGTEIDDALGDIRAQVADIYDNQDDVEVAA